MKNFIKQYWLLMFIVSGFSIGLLVSPEHKTALAQEYQKPTGTPTIVMHDALLDMGGTTARTSTTYLLRDSLSQFVAGEQTTTSGTPIAAGLVGYQYWDQQGPTANTPGVTPDPGTDTTPDWVWTASTDMSGMMGYYLRIGTTVGGCEIVPAGGCDNTIATATDWDTDWLWKTSAEVSCDTDSTCTWTQTPALTPPDTYYISLRARDLGLNIGAYNTSGSYTLDVLLEIDLDLMANDGSDFSTAQSDAPYTINFGSINYSVIATPTSNLKVEVQTTNPSGYQLDVQGTDHNQSNPAETKAGLFYSAGTGKNNLIQSETGTAGDEIDLDTVYEGVGFTISNRNDCGGTYCISHAGGTGTPTADAEFYSLPDANLIGTIEGEWDKVASSNGTADLDAYGLFYKVKASDTAASGTYTETQTFRVFSL